MKKYLLLSLFFWSASGLLAQTAIGSFRAHVSLKGFVSVAHDTRTVYAASDNGLMLLDKSSAFEESPSLSSWSKVDGLSDIDIVKIFMDETYNTLIVCYKNGNIDLVRDDRLLNFPDVKDKALTGSKQVANCRAFDGKVFLVYPFGIVILDLENTVIADTWFTKRAGEPLTPTDIALVDGRFYVSTTAGVFSIEKSSPVINDFMQWRQENDWHVSALAGVPGMVYAVKKPAAQTTGGRDTLCVCADGVWNKTEKSYLAVQQLNSKHDTLMVCDWDGVELMNADMEHLYSAYWYENGVGPDAREAVLDRDNIWVADHVYGLVLNNMTYFSHRFFQASGPYFDYVEGLTSCNGVVAAVHGSRKASSAYAPAFRYPVLSWFENQEWHYNDMDFLAFDTSGLTYDLNNVAVNPSDETEWAVASWGNGVFKCKNQRPVAQYSSDNSILCASVGDRVQVSGLQFDKKGNLWMTNSGCQGMLKMLEPNGEWHSYNIETGNVSTAYEAVTAEHLLIDSRGYKWVNFPRAGVRYPLVAFYDNGTYDNRGDDRLARIDMNAAAEVSSSTVYCMAEDLDGEIWIGTDKGVKVIYYPSKVFDGNVFPRNVLLEQDGYVSVLFEFEEVTAIAVDGANRKWIGTNKAGVFLMSENGQEQLLHFTAEDHPLFSNQIVDINVNQLTGEVFFATAKGLVSYKGTATKGFTSYEDLPVYPNPVPHGYMGAVAVNGLKTNSLCKITDSAGNLVWQGYSDGGQLVWYCKDFHGNRPASGVYYVMASDEEGKEKIVTKFVFVN